MSLSVILLFGALSLSPNIEGQQGLINKTPILFFYSENNPVSLNRPPNTNLIVVQWFHTRPLWLAPGFDDINAVFIENIWTIKIYMDRAKKLTCYS